MKSRIGLAAIAILSLSLIGSVAAQTSTQGDKNPRPALSRAIGSIAASDGKVCDGVDCAVTTIDQAEKSNDPKVLKKALSTAKQQLVELKSRADRAKTVAQRLSEHIDKVETERNKARDAEKSFDSLFENTSEFIIN